MIEIEYSSNNSCNFKNHWENSNRQFDFRITDFPIMYGIYRNANWSQMLQYTDVVTACNTPNHKIYIFERSVPYRCMRTCYFPLLLDGDLIGSVRAKELAYIKL